MITLRYKKLTGDAKDPVRATEDAAGLDLYAAGDPKLEVGKFGFFAEYGTGLAVEIPKGFVGLLFPRSSISKTTSFSLSNSVGVIDSDYRGEVKVRFRDFNELASSKITHYKSGERICQLVIVPCPEVYLSEVPELDDTKRGSGGFGSTGKK